MTTIIEYDHASYDRDAEKIVTTHHELLSIGSAREAASTLRNLDLNPAVSNVMVNGHRDRSVEIQKNPTQIFICKR